MNRNNIYIKGVTKTARRLALGCLLLFFMAGSAWAQTDRQYVIKKDGHYLSHVKIVKTSPDTTYWVLRDHDSFHPDSCIWLSGPNVEHNYYFLDHAERYRYLNARLETNAQLQLSTSNPGIQVLNTKTLDYYFWDWDYGVARGVQQESLENCQPLYNGLNAYGTQCWKVVWVSCEGGAWKMSSAYGYNPTTDAARYHKVTVTEHEEEVTPDPTNPGGVGDLADITMQYGNAPIVLDGTASNFNYTYTPAYTHYYIAGYPARTITGYSGNINVPAIPEESHYYNSNGEEIAAPTPTAYSNVAPSGYAWTLDDETYLSLTENEDPAKPTLTYHTQNSSTSHQMVTLTLTVTYGTGASQVTQVRTATVTVKTVCQNPGQAAAPVVTYEGVTVSWLPTADTYTVSWRKTGEEEWTSRTGVTGTSYTITGLEYNTNYEYKVKAECMESEPSAPYPTFRTKAEPEGLIYGAIFGGGRMADVGGTTEVVIVNCDSIGAVYGGNDIAGTVRGTVNDVAGTGGSTITLGTNSGNAYGTTSTTLKIGSVYGGGNGYYAYGGSSIVQAAYNTVYHVNDGESISAITPSHPEGEAVWTNHTGDTKDMVPPTIPKTSITVTNDHVKVDTLFGGAKNAILNNTSNDVNITINGGTLFAVFGGNNYGGSLGYESHENIVVRKTTIETDSANYNTKQLGRDFGIGYLFGGGNKVAGYNAEITIYGGQTDTIFGGGNSADVSSTHVTVNCGFDAGASGTFGDVYSLAVNSYTAPTLAIKDGYPWNGTGIYNVRTLFGGNNQANMTGLPTLTLTSGSIGTVYGGGNAGDMQARETDDCTNEHDPLQINETYVTYSTHVVLDSPTMLVDNLYGGCQMSNVDRSTWVEVKDGHVGTVYGGCNISGDVGSTRLDLDATPFSEGDTPNEDYQKVWGATYVVASGGTVYKNVFAGGNGFYHCNDGAHYITGVQYDPNHSYVGMTIPTHNETNVIIQDDVLVKGNVYAGGNMAPVGFTSDYVSQFPSFSQLVGLASVRMSGGEVQGNVFGGGNMASINGNIEVQVSGGTIGLALYGGNDRLGKAGQISNRILPESYAVASDNYTSLNAPEPNKVHTYVGVTGNPHITTVYGGGNGAYDYNDMEYCNVSDRPIQNNIFVDICIDGGNSANGRGYIETVYGGGNGVSTEGFIKVFVNVKEMGDNDPEHVGTIYGGNNMGDLALVPEIILLNGNVHTVYGGCNSGAMTGRKSITGGDGTVYENVGSYVRLRESYDPDNDASTNNSVTPNATVSGCVYGGCRSNGVDNNTLVLVEHGNHSSAKIFGGSDISGDVDGTSRVVVTDGTVGNIYGGGNGNYYYNSNNAYDINDHSTIIAEGTVAHPITSAPACAHSRVDILGGQVGATGNGNSRDIFGGGYGEGTQTTGNVEVNIGKVDAASAAATPTIYGDIYGGSALGTVNNNTSVGTPYTTTVNFLNGTLHGNVYGGGLGRKAVDAVTDPEDPEVIVTPAVAGAEAKVFGKVFVNISNSTQTAAQCFIDLRGDNIYGCNNTNGSPQDDVEVHVWKTHYTTGDYDSQTGTSYAIDQVFGGGNHANYAPENVNENSTKKTLVYIHDCLNTIRRVFSGGNAAAATGVSTNIEGGRFDYVFGGGNGEVSAANIGNGGTTLTVSAGLINHLYGGSNQQGVVSGSVITDINGSHYVPEDDEFNDPCNEEIAEFYGGSNAVDLGSDGHPISIETTIECGSGMFGTIYGGCNQADIIGNVSLTIQGGNFTYVYGGSKGVADDGADISGDVTLNLEGGTIRTAFGGSNVKGNIGGRITVNVIDIEDCPLVIDTIFGGGNHANYEPTYSSSERISPLVNVMHIKPTAQAQGIRGCVFGGGNEAWVTSSPRVNIGYNATYMPNAIPTGVNTGSLTDFPQTYVKGKIFGGGNNITAENKGVEGNTRIYVYNGQVCQNIATGEQSVGIYGGCNTSGTVTGNSHVAILGGTIGNSTTRANIHGGGFGSATEVKNNVTVDFGAVAYDESGEDPVEIHTDYPLLYGDLYGGSALGNVNHNNTQTTTVNILNGEITGVGTSGDGRYGNVFGGGLGDASHAALVHGRVYVNVGACGTEPSSNLTGKAKLIDCNIFGCNNISGSPQDSVYVHVYQTDHIEGVNTVNNGDKYAILRVYGGGNLSNYAPENNNPNSGKKTHVYVHSCDNTIKYVFGGSNAAAAVGVQTLIEGGRFDEIYGGGNGTTLPANIGLGGIGINVNGGHARYYFEGCNQLGTIAGPINQPRPSFPTGYTECSGNLVIDSYFFGDNEAEHYGDLVGEITCEQGSHFNYKYVFAGSRWAIVYGDIKLTVKGGNIQYLYGGSKGYGEVDNPRPADVRRFPSYAELNADDLLENQKYSSALKAYMRDTINHPERKALVGHGGNIVLTVQGGTIGDVIGGCEELGNVEGKITVIIDALDDTDCPLVLGNVYGASKQTNYVPTNDATHHAYYEPTTAYAVPTPQVKILKGTVGSDTPETFIVSGETHQMEGNVFGGGDIGNVTANPKVIIGESSNTNDVEIKGNVYGGGKQGAVNGSPGVIVVPNKHTLTITQPENTSQGVIRVTDRYNNSVSSDTEIDEYQDLNLVAIPSAYGWKLNKWEVTNGSVLFEKSVNTMFTMGTDNALITASFVSVPTNTLTIAHEGPGRVTVTDGLNAGVDNNASIGEGAVLNLLAEPTENSGYAFLEWVVTGTGSSVANEYDPNTTFTMGTANTTVTAVFKPTHKLIIGTPDNGSITVLDILGRAVHTGADIVEGAILTIVANPDDGYEFSEWTVTNGTVADSTAIATTFVMGTADASITATFTEQQSDPRTLNQ